MDKKYWVPALERADLVLSAIARQPSGLKLIDLSKQLGINKSSMFSLLHTMETLHWVVRDKGDTYSLGSALGLIGNAFIRQYDLIGAFHREASASKALIGETIQLGKLEMRDVLYLAKEDLPSPVRLASDPGMKFPAHATALGKAILAMQDPAEVAELFRDAELPVLTPYTNCSTDRLLEELSDIRTKGYAYDLQESVIGFCCVAAPVLNADNSAIAAVSCSMPLYYWEQKQQTATDEIVSLALRLSLQY